MTTGPDEPVRRCPAPTAMASLMPRNSTATSTPAIVRAGRRRRCDSGWCCGAKGGGVGAVPQDGEPDAAKLAGGAVGAVGGIGGSGALGDGASCGDPLVSVTIAA